MPRALASLLFLLSAPALAARVPLDPQTRVHAGVSVTGTPDIGVALGLDARMTRLVFMDLGGFVSPAPLADDIAHPDDPSEALRLRHGLYATPGLRIPHSAKEGLTWDLIFRGGIGAVWVADLTPSDAQDDSGFTVNLDPAGVGGLDLLLRKDKVGGRASAKVFAFTTVVNDSRDAEFRAMPVGTIELFYQF